MAFVTQRPAGRWEVRESRATSKGPRSRTLASFSELNDEILDRAESRASQPFDREALRRAALRAGAPLQEPKSDRAARELLSELDAGRGPRKALRGLLAGEVRTGPAISSDAARAAAAWLDATPERRGKTLVDLLLLGDRLPHTRRRELRFPPLARA